LAELNAVPKEIISYVYKPRARLFHVVVQLTDVPGALAEITSSLAKSKLNILGGFISGIDIVADAKNQRADDNEKPLKVRSAGLFLEAQDRDVTAQRIKSLIHSSPYTQEVSVQESADGLIVDSLNFPLRLSQGQRAIVLRSDVISSSMQEIRRIFDTGGDVMLYKQGFAAGTNDAEELIRIFGEVDIPNRLEQLIDLYSSLGWGKAKIVEVDLEKHDATITLEDNFECAGQKRRSKPYSQFVRGHLAGLATRLLSTEMKCIETRCAATGDPYCEFSLSF
jgi:predicted hydrocarbon binding protein